MSHRVLLEGGAVGTQKYGVKGVPANFWINKQGKIVHQSTDFREREVKKMEQWIAEIL